MDPKRVDVAGRALQRSHRPGEALGHELGIEDGPIPQDRKSLGETPKATSERAVALPVADLTIAIPRLDDAVRAENDQPANAINLGLDRVARGLGDGGADRPKAVIGD